MCIYINLKPGGIIELLLNIVNVLHMRPRLGVAHSDQPAQHGYSGVRPHPAKSAKRFCALKDVVCKWYPSLEVEVPAALTRNQVFFL